MRTIRLLIPLGVIGSIATGNAAPTPHNINASAIGTGVHRGLSWSDEANQTPIWCGTACGYLQISTAKIAPETVPSYLPSGWPGSFVTSFPHPAAIEDAIPTPQGTFDSAGREIIHDSTTYERAAVDAKPFMGQSMSAKVYQSGSQPAGENGAASSVMAYHVRVQNQSSGGRDYFVRFVAPKSKRSMSPAFYYGGPSGNEVKNHTQQFAKARSNVDVLVNGLPVWSTASNYFFPETHPGDVYDGFIKDWGYESDDDHYTIFIGRFASAASFNLDFIVRADSEARAPTCGTVNESSQYPSPRSFIHCFLLTEGRTLPDASSPAQRFEIYSKVVSTILIPPQGGFSSLED